MFAKKYLRYLISIHTAKRPAQEKLRERFLSSTKYSGQCGENNLPTEAVGERAIPAERKTENMHDNTNNSKMRRSRGTAEGNLSKWLRVFVAERPETKTPECGIACVTIETKFQLKVHSIHYRKPGNEGHTFHCRAAFTRARHNIEKLTSYPLDSQCPNIENSGSFLGRQAGPCGGKTPQTNSVILARKRRKNISMRHNDVHKRKRTENDSKI